MVYQFKRILSLMFKQKYAWKGFCWDTLLALVGALAVTLLIYVLGLYPRIPNIELLYLIVVLALASTRGLFPAIAASVVAFFSFDFFLTQPLFSFSIAKPEEWLALIVFLCTAVITGQLAAAMRSRAEQARQRERETRILYELVRDTNEEEDLDHQLSVMARTMVDAFGPQGVRDCLILLPDEQGKPILRVSASSIADQLQLTPDQLTTAAWVLREGKTVEFYHLPRASDKTSAYVARMVIRSTTMSLSSRNYLSLFPLKTGQKVIGVLALLMQEDPRLFSHEKRLGSEANHSDPGSAFFWTFIDQSASMIERARLRRESLQVEVLQRTDALRAALISSVSHDLRTPLTSIKAAASSLLQDDVQWDEEARRSFTQAIEHEADRLNRLVENLLDISRIEGGALKPEKEWYPLDELLHDVLNRMQARLVGRKLMTEIVGDLPPVELDYVMIDQVLTNLVENALRYTPADSPIEFVVTTTASEVYVSLADHGPGVPPGDLERIFDKFYRVLGSAREVSGSGLGLAVCRGLIEAHGGRIWAKNRQGGGAIFQFTLPLHAPKG